MINWAKVYKVAAVAAVVIANAAGVLFVDAGLLGWLFCLEIAVVCVFLVGDNHSMRERIKSQSKHRDDGTKLFTLLKVAKPKPKRVKKHTAKIIPLDVAQKG